MTIPTKTAVAIASASELDKLFKDTLLWRQHLGQFQRMSLVCDYETSLKVIAPYLGRSINSEDDTILRLIHGLTKNDVLATAIEQLVNISETSNSDKDRLAASTIVNELFGEKDLIKDVKLTDKLMINLVGNG